MCVWCVTYCDGVWCVRLCAIVMIVHLGLTICMRFDCGLLCHVVWRVLVLSVFGCVLVCVWVEIFVC